MGGISIIIATCIMGIIGTIAFGGTIGDELLIILVFAGYGIIGFVDDYRKVIRKQNEGLTAKQKFAMQMIIAIAFAVFFGTCEQQRERKIQEYVAAGTVRLSEQDVEKSYRMRRL